MRALVRILVTSYTLNIVASLTTNPVPFALPNRASWYDYSGYWVPSPFVDRVLRLRLAGTAGGPMNATTNQVNNFTLLSGLFSSRASRSPGMKIQSTCCSALAGPRPSLGQLVGTLFGNASTGRGNMRCSTTTAGFPLQEDCDVVIHANRVRWGLNEAVWTFHVLCSAAGTMVVFHRPRRIR